MTGRESLNTLKMFGAWLGTKVSISVSRKTQVSKLFILFKQVQHQVDAAQQMIEARRVQVSFCFRNIF